MRLLPTRVKSVPHDWLFLDAHGNGKVRSRGTQEKLQKLISFEVQGKIVS